MRQMLHRLTIAAAVWLSVCTTQSQAQTVTNPDFSYIYDRVYQIVVLEIETDSKSALGSGFQVTEDGLVVTNYHVVASFVYEPERFRVEYVAQNGDTGVLTLQTFDVISDLAIFRREEPPPDHFEMAMAELKRGDSVYALGNPYDIGMLMVSGAYNGLVEKSYSERILFSGSLNAGMSGGPAVDESGRLVGVNVSTAGSQLSFLVPIENVRRLLADAVAPLPLSDYMSRMAGQIESFQQTYFDELLDGTWELEDLGDAVEVAGEMGLDTSCWGHSNEDDEDVLHLSLLLTCNNASEIYLQPNLNTGVLHYSYTYLEALGLGAYRFHRLLADNTYWPDNRANDEEVTEFECEQSYLVPEETAPDDHFVQAGFCSRAYVNLAGLYDVVFYRTSAGNDSALTAHFTLSGVNHDVASRFTARFLEHVSWK